jgi:hypothetical protein
MNTKLKKGLTYLAAGLFLIALFINVKTTIDDPFFFQRAMAQVEDGTEDATTYSWWDSPAYDCIPNCPCMTEILCSMNAGGSWGPTGGSFNIGSHTLRLSGTKTKTRRGGQVAHRWNCPGRQCVVSNADIIAALEALN